MTVEIEKAFTNENEMLHPSRRFTNAMDYARHIHIERYERTVDRDNTVSFYNVIMQLERTEWRPTLAGCKVIIHQHLDQSLTLRIAGHRVGHYSAEGKLLTPLTKKQIKAVEKTLKGKVKKPTSHFNLQIPQTTRDSHFTTASTATDN